MKSVKKAIEAYKTKFQSDKGLHDERYKWEIITKLYRCPNLDADDFAEEVKKLNFANLVYGPQRTAIRNLGKLRPEQYREAFRKLMDETADLQGRIEAFIETSKLLWNEIKDNFDKETSALCDERIISALLSCYYPDKYTFYKQDVYSRLCEMTGEKPKRARHKLTHFYDMLNRYVIPEVQKETELLDAIAQEVDSANLRHSLPLVAQTVLWCYKNEIDTNFNMPTNTPTSTNPYPDDVKKLADTIDGKDILPEDESNGNADCQYWWIVGNPKIFDFNNLAVGDTVEWTLYNDNGHKRRIFQNFLEAKKGDIVIGYDATPVLQIVALLTVERTSDGETILFKKTETLRTPIEYSFIKSLTELQSMQYIKNQQGSFFKVLPNEYDILLDIIREANPVQTIPEKKETYDKAKFLEEVYMSATEYERLKGLLLAKQNIIIEGAPGVGKTFAAKRLAYSILGEKDDDKVMSVQFHQNYSYEDFIMGYKPNDNGGFYLQRGIFYQFCKRAKADYANKYFFIIDEINRGNLSKIFGELLMLVEKDYRGKPMQLAYNGEEFSVPENLYIIGMMNTADRSLAMIDYALRRRFSFFPMKPGFDSDGFKKRQAEVGEERFNKVIDGIKTLNFTIEKDDSLGAGFCIGHSYFCVTKESYSDEWLSGVLDFDIEPMLREYWFDNHETYQNEITKLKNLLK